MCNEDLDFVKAKFKEGAVSSYITYNSKVSQNISNNEFITLQNISKKRRLDYSEIW